MPEIIDPVFAKTSQNARFLLSENERFGLVFVKNGSINSGTGLVKRKYCIKTVHPEFCSDIEKSIVRACVLIFLYDSKT